MAKESKYEPEVFTSLPEGVVPVKRYRDGMSLVLCHHNMQFRHYPPAAMLEGSSMCLFCKVDTFCSKGYAIPVKKLIVQFGKYPEYAAEKTTQIRAWLRHWQKQVSLNQSDLVYDPEEEVKKLTEELQARGAKT